MSGRVALVTGGSGAIGSAIARALRARGWRIVVHYHTHAEEAESLAEELGESIALAADVTAEEEVRRLVESATEALGPIECLVSNAGVLSDRFLPMLSEAEWDRCVDTSLKGAFLLTKHCLRGMMRAKWGRLIYISSVAGLSGDVARAHYAAAKSGLIGFARSAAREVGRGGITANIVCPGVIDTPLIEGMNESRARELQARIPLGRWGTAGEVAAAVGFLASDEASYITGAVLTVDGGLSM